MTETPSSGRGPFSGPAGQRLAAHRVQLLQLLDRHGVTRPEVFGSVARGEDREDSDVELMVDIAPGTDIVDLVRIKRELEELLGVPVDLVPRNGLSDHVRGGSQGDLVPL